MTHNSFSEQDNLFIKKHINYMIDFCIHKTIDKKTFLSDPKYSQCFVLNDKKILIQFIHLFNDYVLPYNDDSIAYLLCCINKSLYDHIDNFDNYSDEIQKQLLFLINFKYNRSIRKSIYKEDDIEEFFLLQDKEAVLFEKKNIKIAQNYGFILEKLQNKFSYYHKIKDFNQKFNTSFGIDYLFYSFKKYLLEDSFVAEYEKAIVDSIQNFLLNAQPNKNDKKTNKIIKLKKMTKFSLNEIFSFECLKNKPIVYDYYKQLFSEPLELYKISELFTVNYKIEISFEKAQNFNKEAYLNLIRYILDNSLDSSSKSSRFRRQNEIFSLFTNLLLISPDDSMEVAIEFFEKNQTNKYFFSNFYSIADKVSKENQQMLLNFFCYSSCFSTKKLWFSFSQDIIDNLNSTQLTALSIAKIQGTHLHYSFDEAVDSFIKGKKINQEKIQKFLDKLKNDKFFFYKQSQNIASQKKLKISK